MTTYAIDLTADLTKEIEACRKAQAEGIAAMRRIPLTIADAVDAQRANAAHRGKEPPPYDDSAIAAALAGHRIQNEDRRTRVFCDAISPATAAILDKAIRLIEPEVARRDKLNAEMLALGAASATDVAGPLREKLRSLREIRSCVGQPGRHVDARSALDGSVCTWS